MVEWDTFIKRANGLAEYVQKQSSELLFKRSKEIVELNNKQLMQGKGKSGDIMQRGYSSGYSKLRKKKGLQTSYVDLKFTGKYQDTRKGVKSQKGLNIISDVDYEKYLRGNFPDHVGLTSDNQELIKELLVPELAVMIKKYLTQ